MSICTNCQHETASAAGRCPWCGTRTGSEPVCPIEPGMMLADRFRILHRHGRGGLGEVRLAQDSLLDDDRVAC